MKYIKVIRYLRNRSVIIQSAAVVGAVSVARVVTALVGVMAVGRVVTAVVGVRSAVVGVVMAVVGVMVAVVSVMSVGRVMTAVIGVMSAVVGVVTAVVGAMAVGRVVAAVVGVMTAVVGVMAVGVVACVCAALPSNHLFSCNLSRTGTPSVRAAYRDAFYPWFDEKSLPISLYIYFHVLQLSKNIFKIAADFIV